MKKIALKSHFHFCRSQKRLKKQFFGAKYIFFGKRNSYCLQTYSKLVGTPCSKWSIIGQLKKIIFFLSFQFPTQQHQTKAFSNLMHLKRHFPPSSETLIKLEFLNGFFSNLIGMSIKKGMWVTFVEYLILYAQLWVKYSVLWYRKSHFSFSFRIF